MDTLCARNDFLSSHENVVRVRVPLVARLRHRVEGANVHWEASQHKKIRVVLLVHKLAQRALSFGVEVIEIPDRVPVVAKHLDRFGESENEVFATRPVLEGSRRVLLVDSLQFKLTSLIQPIEYRSKHCINEFQDLIVMVTEGHFDVESHKFAQMAMRVAVLGPEDGSDREDAVKIGANRHLLVELRRLRQTRGAPKIIQGEHVGPSFGCPADQLGGLNFCKVVLLQKCPEEMANRGLNQKNALVRGYPQVKSSVLQASFTKHMDAFLGFGSPGIHQGKWQG
mmetsp:Transcript_12883/g.32660  ORF Transcript_12883/g.32660 Transcript_12883/m.32660 type:complete len:282 (-) Transcript_12883:620-1465(-)